MSCSQLAGRVRVSAFKFFVQALTDKRLGLEELA